MAVTLSKGKKEAISKMTSDLEIEFNKLQISKKLEFGLFKDILFTTKGNKVFLATENKLIKYDVSARTSPIKVLEKSFSNSVISNNSIIFDKYCFDQTEADRYDLNALVLSHNCINISHTSIIHSKRGNHKLRFFDKIKSIFS